MVSGASLTKAAPPTPVDDSSEWRLIWASPGESPRSSDTAIREPSGDHTGQLYVASRRWGCARMPPARATAPVVSKLRPEPSGLEVTNWPSASMYAMRLIVMDISLCSVPPGSNAQAIAASRTAVTAARKVRHRRARTGIRQAARFVSHGNNLASTRVTVASNMPLRNGRAIERIASRGAGPAAA